MTQVKEDGPAERHMGEQQQSEQQDRAIAQERTVATREPSQLRGLGPDGRVSTIAHTPTPWFADTAGDVCAGPYCIAILSGVRDAESEANAAFIVRACNSHDALVDALAEMIRLADMGFEASMAEPEENGNYAAYNKARAALASAQAAK